MIVNLLKMYSGFCDRLRPITFGIMLSRLNYVNNKKINIIEKKTKECPFLFTNLCEIRKFKTKRIKINKRITSNYCMSPFNSEINEKNLVKHMPYKIKNSKNLIKMWKNSYKFIYPVKKIKKKIDNLHLPKNYVGIHIRSTDKVLGLFPRLFEIPSKSSITNFQLDLFLKNLPLIVRKNSKHKNIYLACDDRNIKEEAKKKLEKYDFNVFENKGRYFIERMRQTNGNDFIVDLFCLAGSKIIISSTGGGVPSTAQLLSRKKINIINYLDEKNIFYFIKILNHILYNIRNIFKNY